MNTVPLDQNSLDIVSKTRSNPLPWRGQFSPQLVEAIVRQYTTEDSIILDPFVGSGTVLLECARLGRVGLGNEINPAAATLARVYCCANMTSDERMSIIREVHEAFDFVWHTKEDTLFKPVQSGESLKALLIFKRDCLSPAARILADALICLSDFYRPDLSTSDVRSSWSRLVRLVRSLPNARQAIQVALADARRIPVPDASIDIVVTSPPYINVFNYHQQFRASMEALGWDLLHVAKSEIGSNRKHRSNRVMTIAQYCLDMTQVLLELWRAVRIGGSLILIIGRESSVRKTSIQNSRILREIATTLVGFSLALKQERTFTNKFGLSIREEVLHLEKEEVTSKKIAQTDLEDYMRSLLIEASRRAPLESRSDFEFVIDHLRDIACSPILQPTGHAAHISIPIRFDYFDARRN
jgi:hypothetical protein